MATVQEHNERALVYLNSMRRMLKERMDEHRQTHPEAMYGDYAPAVTEEFLTRFLILARMHTDEKIAALEAQKEAAEYGG